MTIKFISSIQNGITNICKNIKNKPPRRLASKLSEFVNAKVFSPDTVGKFGMPPKLPSEIAKKLAACAAGVGVVGVAGSVNSTTAKFDDRTALYSTTAVNSTTARQGLKSGVFSTTA